MLVKWKEATTSACPRCGEHENARHVWTCQEPAVFFVWALLMSAFSKWLESVHTANDVIYWIIQRLTEWRSAEPFSRAQSDMPGLLQAINAQDQIGWLAFLEGCIAVEWAGAQDAHFLWLGRRNTGKRWAASLVVKLWEAAWDLWDHRNQVKKHVETAQDVARRAAIMLAICSEHTFGKSGLPRRDWRLFTRPLRSVLASSLHHMDAWLLRVQTARSRKDRRDAEALDPSVNTAEDNLPSMNGLRRVLQQFLKSAVHQPQSP